MSVFQRIRFMLAVLAQIVGVFWMLMAVYFVAMYCVDAENELRHEYLLGVWIGFLYATGFTLGGAVLAASVKQQISKLTFRLLALPALVVGVAFLALYLGSMAYDLVSRV